MKKTFKLGSKQKTITRTLSSSRDAIKFIKKMTEIQESVIMDPFADGYKESNVSDLELKMMDLYVQRAADFLEQPEEYFEDIDYFEIVNFVLNINKFLSQNEEPGKTSGEA
ncbi:hypothetical protein [Leuconostoc lactis]|uniref:hypothetical protein n=1 Tax=Leuconostoc lactis TaxID=1246 RepID=UPI0024ADA7CA|nr:hypothetical protein [Leuconostoc lactis]MDI6495506.1 hypothetical protein [Leuconostoc lactis]